MSEYFLNEEYARSVNKEIATTAEDMLSGKLNFLLGSRILASLSFKVPKMDMDPDFRRFVGIASETDDFPLGRVQDLWDEKALEKLAPKMQEAEVWARKLGEPACLSLIARFGGKHSH